MNLFTVFILSCSWSKIKAFIPKQNTSTANYIPFFYHSQSANMLENGCLLQTSCPGKREGRCSALTSDGYDRVPFNPWQWREGVPAWRRTLGKDGPETYIPTELVETHLMPQHIGLGISSEPCKAPELRGIESLDASETQHVSWGNERTELEKRLYFCKGAARTKHNPIPRERKASLFFPPLLHRASLYRCPQTDYLGGNMDHNQAFSGPHDSP